MGLRGLAFLGILGEGGAGTGAWPPGCGPAQPDCIWGAQLSVASAPATFASGFQAFARTPVNLLFALGRMLGCK